MIAAAIVCAAAFSQAATANWVAVEIFNNPGAGKTAGDEDYNTGYLAYFVDSATYDYETAVADVAKGDLSFLTAAGVYATSDFVDDGAIDTFTADRYGNEQDVMGYVVIVDADTIDAAKYAFITSEETGTTGGAGQSAYLEFDASGTAVGNNWSAVPEPTSGLLLLLGVAGLALRRRRA